MRRGASAEMFVVAHNHASALLGKWHDVQLAVTPGGRIGDELSVCAWHQHGALAAGQSEGSRVAQLAGGQVLNLGKQLHGSTTSRSPIWGHNRRWAASDRHVRHHAGDKMALAHFDVLRHLLRSVANL
jgi:hypothetical protein